MTIYTLNNLSRRGFLGGFAALAATPALSLTSREAEILVSGLVGDINAAIGSGKSEATMIGDFTRIFGRYGDVPAIARSALGPTARSLSTSELSSYTQAFQGYIGRKYGKRFREFIGGRIEVNGARQAGRFYEVSTTAFLRGENPFELTFIVSDRSGQDRFVNMLIEGVNLLATERVEITALLDRNRGNVNGLIDDLKRAG
ncbi:MAG: ABC transporter substrate-binding protein [Rhodobacteraceae bacterium]|nr:ABC transporter substrate-binding protein [Paracoccaceae bacterium]